MHGRERKGEDLTNRFDALLSHEWTAFEKIEILNRGSFFFQLHYQKTLKKAFDSRISNVLEI